MYEAKLQYTEYWSILIRVVKLTIRNIIIYLDKQVNNTYITNKMQEKKHIDKINRINL